MARHIRPNQIAARRSEARRARLQRRTTSGSIPAANSTRSPAATEKDVEAVARRRDFEDHGPSLETNGDRVLAGLDVERPGLATDQITHDAVVDEHAAGKASWAGRWLDTTDRDRRGISGALLDPPNSELFGQATEGHDVGSPFHRCEAHSESCDNSHYFCSIHCIGSRGDAALLPLFAGSASEVLANFEPGSPPRFVPQRQ